jgi:predicted CXXCH cytochrome family protein
MTVLLALSPGVSESGTYMSTKHGMFADRSVIGATLPYATPGHCGQCHEQHASVQGAEPEPPVGQGASRYALFESNFGAFKNQLCYECHERFTLEGMLLGYGRYGIYQGKTKYDDSIHATSLNMLWSPDPSPPGPALDDAGNCHNCHNPHGFSDALGLINSMAFAREESLCEACHDGTQAGAAENVKAQFAKTYSHPTHAYTGRHVLPENGQPGGTSFGPDNRHAECSDCHNAHALGPAGDTHAPPGNAVSEALQGTWGVEPAWPSIWTQPTSFTEQRPPLYPDGSQYEYQICFKCHSYYGLGTQLDSVSAIVGPSGQYITDQAWEFNPNNKSAHPVAVGLANMPGSSPPQALPASGMKAPWTQVGAQSMYCSDCHGQEDTLLEPEGPHGSNVKFMLKGRMQYWPTGPGGLPWTLADAGNPGLFCNNCHDIYNGGAWNNKPHSVANHQDKLCVNCHVTVPHGSKRSRLIGYATDPAPYNYLGMSLVISGFKKAAPWDYTAANCQASCHSVHANPVVGAEP